MDNCENEPAFANTPGVACASFSGRLNLPEDLLTRIREELTCAICFDVATRPATLPCGHSACRRCLNAAMAVAVPANKRRCPVCRQQLPMGLPRLAINSTLKNIAELLLPEECKERAGTTPEEERRPQEWVQRVLLCTRSRAVSLHTTYEITAQANRSAVAGLNALLGVMEERWPEGRHRPPARSPAAAAARAPARSPAPASAPAPARSPTPASSPAPARSPAPGAEPGPAYRGGTPRSTRLPVVMGSQHRLERPRWRSAAARDPPPSARHSTRGDRTPVAARRLAEFASPQVAQDVPAGQREAAPELQPVAVSTVLPSSQPVGAAPQPLLTTVNRQGVVPSPPPQLRTARQATITELAEQLGIMHLGVLGRLGEAAASGAEPGLPDVPVAEEAADEEIPAAEVTPEPGPEVALQMEATLVAVGEEAQPAAATAETDGAAQEDADSSGSGELLQAPMIFHAGASPGDAGMAVGAGRRRRGHGRRTSGTGDQAGTPSATHTGRHTPIDRTGLPIWL